MATKKITQWITGVIAAFTLVYVTSCDLYKSEQTEISGEDKTACEQLSDSVFTVMQSVPIGDVFPDTSNADLSQVVAALTDSLFSDSLFLIQNAELAYDLTLGSGNDTTYIGLQANKNAILLFVTEIVETHLYTRDGTELAVNDDIMPKETISGCTFLEEGKVQPLIKVRLQYQGQPGEILLQLIKVEQTKNTNFKITVH